MQQQVPIRRYVYFFVSVLALTYAWSWLRPTIFPPPPDQRAARVVPVLTGSPMTDAVVLTAQHLRGPVKSVERPTDEDRSRLALQQARPVARLLAAGAGQPLAVDGLARLAEVLPPPRELSLGGEGFAITAMLSDRGGGVRELILNDFPAADRLGLPERTVGGKPKPVVLIPRNDAEPPSFALFHYATADDDDARPLDTLGRERWAVVRDARPANATQEVAFAAELPDVGVRIVKTFSLAPHEYHLGLTVRVERLAHAAAGKFRYQLAGASGLPIEGEWYATTFRTAMIGLTDSTDAVHRVTLDNRQLAHSSGSDRYRRDGKQFIYAAVAVQFFASAMVMINDAGGLADKPGPVQFVRATLEGEPDPRRPFLDDITVRAIVDPIELAPGAAREQQYLLYHGPVKVRQLSRLGGTQLVAPELVDRYADTLRLNTLTDYGSFGWWTDLIIVFTNLIHRLVGLLSAVLPAGLVIIAVTVIVRGMMFPISKRQAVAMQKMQDKMAKLGPEMKEIERKFGDDFLAKRQAQSELYRRHGVNPAAGLSGCLMLLLQMPIFMGLYYALQESVFFRLEPFLWIRNLTAPDMLVWWSENIPGISTPDSMGSMFYLGPYFNLLPILGAILIFIQQKMAMPKEMSDEQRQQFTMMKYMTFLMAFMFYRVPSGLSLYFIASSTWGLIERKLVKRHIAAQAQEPPKPVARGAVSGRNGAKPKTAQTTKSPSRLQLWWEKVLREASKK